MTKHSEHLPVTPLTMSILLALAERDLHGYALMKAVAAQTDGRLKPGTGSLYAALERLLDGGHIEEIVDAEASRGKKSYRLTPAGRALASAEAERMLQVIRVAIDRDMRPVGLEDVIGRA